MANELKPCPFCGTGAGNIDRKTRTNGELFQAYHECFDCGAQGPATAWYNDGVGDGDGSGALHWLDLNVDEDGWNTRTFTEGDVERAVQAGVSGGLGCGLFGPSDKSATEQIAEASARAALAALQSKD